MITRSFRRLGFCLIATSLKKKHFVVLLSNTLCDCSRMPIGHGMHRIKELLVPPSAQQSISSPGFLDGVVSDSKGDVALLGAPPSAFSGEIVFDGLGVVFQEDFVHSWTCAPLRVLVALVFAAYVTTGFEAVSGAGGWSRLGNIIQVCSPSLASLCRVAVLPFAVGYALFSVSWMLWLCSALFSDPLAPERQLRSAFRP